MLGRMQAMDLNALFTRAEQAFISGQLDIARVDLAQVQRLAGDHPAVLHLLALVEKKRGALAESRSAFVKALRLAPNDPEINNNFANLLDAGGEPETALRHFDRAVAAAPAFEEARFNRALLLHRLGRLEESLADLASIATGGKAGAKVHSARAAVLRELGHLEEAAEAYDAALRLEPKRFVALHGRARVAMELGQDDASDYYRRALELKPNDLLLRLGLAESLEAEGREGAVDTLAAAVLEHPQWIEGQTSLARMRWESGEGPGFTRQMESALQAAPSDRDLWLAYASALAGAEHPLAAADALACARAAVGEDPRLQLAEALHASEAGELDRADKLFAALPAGLPGRSLHEARHAIRRNDYGLALGLAATARAEDEWNVGAWAITGLLWRLTGDARGEWLHEQPSLVRVLDLQLNAGEIGAIAERLRRLHRTRAHPIGQSLRGGTQTRGRLFYRAEPEIRLLRAAVEQAVQDYWESLPAADETHPLLRHRRRSPAFGGSWSVRLTDGGFHVAHIHPHGVVSSACYIVVPAAGSAREGWLEIGRPPNNLQTELLPLAEVEPAPGKLALFPSTLFHGTRPFPVGERLTSAFDIVLE